MAALSLGGGRRRWACRAARRGARGGAGCRHFHVHVRLPRQVRAFSCLRRFLLWPSCLLVLPPVLLLAALAFLVCFGWFTLVLLVSSLLSKAADDRHDLLVSTSNGEPCGGGEQAGEERLAAERVAAQAFSPGIFVNDDEHPDDEKVVEEVVVTVFEASRRGSGASEDLSCSPEKRGQVLDVAVDCFLEEHGVREFSQICWTEKLLDVQPCGEGEFAVNAKEVPGYYPASEVSEFVDRHEAGARADVKVEGVKSSDDSVHGAPGDEHGTEMDQEQSMVHSSAANKLPEEDAVLDECHEARNSESESESESAATSNASFHHQASSDQDDRQEEELTESKGADSSSPASAPGDDHWRKIGQQPGGFGNEENSNGEYSQKTSVVERAGDQDEGSDDNFTSVGAPRRLPLVRRSPAPWWHLCGVLDVLAGGED